MLVSAHCKFHTHSLCRFEDNIQPTIKAKVLIVCVAVGKVDAATVVSNHKPPTATTMNMSIDAPPTTYLSG